MAARFIGLHTVLWLLNSTLIISAEHLGLPRNIGALLAVAPLALASFTMQRNWVFRAL